MTPFSFLGQSLSPNTPVCGFHDKGDLRKDFLHNATLAHHFWLLWMKSYVTSLQGRNKWRTVRPNLVPSQLVLVDDAEDLAHKGAYRLGRVHSLHPQIRRLCSSCYVIAIKNSFNYTTNKACSFVAIYTAIFHVYII